MAATTISQICRLANSSFSCFVYAFFISYIWQPISFFPQREMTYFAIVRKTVSTWRQIFTFMFLSPNRAYQFHSKVVRTHFVRQTTWENRQVIAETQSYIFKWHSCWRRHLRFLIRELKQVHITNLHIWQWKTAVLHALHKHFPFLDISQTLSFFPRSEMTCFAAVWTTWAYDV